MGPFYLVYKIDPIFPVQLKICTLQFMKNYIEIDDTIESRLVQLIKIEEKQDQAF